MATAEDLEAALGAARAASLATVESLVTRRRVVATVEVRMRREDREPTRVERDQFRAACDATRAAQLAEREAWARVDDVARELDVA